jgi:16S rRNA (adenine1518-N6/adenine1519-N6)-dimethyltransferase
LLGPAAIRDLAQHLGLRPTKTLGQNFLHDANTIRRIVRTAELTPEDVVLEVGPGLGSLTLGLLPVAAHVTAVEIDPRLAALLPRTVAERAPALADRLTVVEADALRVREVPGPAPTALVANLPYNVAVPVLLHLLELLPTLRRALVLVQAEVAERLAAAPGSPAYGVPSAEGRPGTATCAGPATSAGGSSGPSPTSTPAWSPSTAVRRRRATAPRPSPSSTPPSPPAARGCAAALARWAGSPGAAEARLRAAGHRPDHPGEQLSVADFARLAATRARHELVLTRRDPAGWPGTAPSSPGARQGQRAPRVGPLRPDGFHELRTVYLAVSLFDTVTVRPGDGLSLTVTGEGTTGSRPGRRPTDRRNLVWRAAELLAERAGVPPTPPSPSTSRSRPRPGWPGAARTPPRPSSPSTRCGARTPPAAS